MLSCGKAIFIDPGKTGTSFLENLLRPAVTKLAGTRHAPIQLDSTFGDKLIFTTLRNPYTYIVSHFTYGRKTRGPIYNSLGRPETFEQYVVAMNQNHGTFPPSENDLWQNTDKTVGGLTFRYLRMIDANFLSQPRKKSEIRQWYKDHWFNTESNLRMIGSKDLREEIIQLIEDNPGYFTVRPNWKEILLTHQVNDGASKNQKLDYSEWHTEKTKQIISETEDILIEQYGFTI